MLVTVKKTKRLPTESSVIYFCRTKEQIHSLPFTTEEKSFIIEKIKDQKACTVTISKVACLKGIVFVLSADKNAVELARKEGANLLKEYDASILKELTIVGLDETKEILLDGFLGGFLLADYQFTKYKSKPKERKEKIISLFSDFIYEEDITRFLHIIEAVYICRNLVNEPLCYLNAEQLAAECEKLGNLAGIKTEILNKAKIETLKMGGILAVNKGSVDPPTFTIMEWNPQNKVNTQPIVLVGKGVVYDTGGMNLKPDDSMNDMKGDMAGVATAACVVYAAAKNKLPVHVIALLPATDNRPGGNAYVSGDIVTMYNGITVEVLNTDAEGRMILADALSYAAHLNPEVVIDMATLTGAAQRAIGSYGIVAMQQDAEKEMLLLKAAGEEEYERIAEFPFWDEYDELIQSEIADIKNLGGAYAGMITAGKFLARFTSYPFIHLDIAGVAFSKKALHYTPSGGTGYGVRLLYRFLEEKVRNKKQNKQE